MKFIKYPSLINTYRLKDTNHVINNYKETEFCVYEKLDGANFAFYCDNFNNIKVASRNQFVDTSFFNCGNVIELMQPKIEALIDHLQDYPIDYDYFIIYGELVGNKIQKRVKYSTTPDNFVDFYCFDIKLVKNEKVSGFVSQEQLSAFLSCTRCIESGLNINFIKPLMTGSFEECLNYSNDKKSTILNIEDNIMEGVVIKPYNKIIYDIYGHTLIFKNKNEKFTEKSKVDKIKITIKSPVDFIQYINENRLLSIVSKMGGLDNLTQKDFGKILCNYSKDVIEDLIQDGVLEIDYKKSNTFKIVPSLINKAVSKYLQKELLGKL